MNDVVKIDAPKKNHHLLIWFSGILILAAFIWLLLWLFYFQFHQSTDDAYANGNLININSVIPGSVVAFFADDTDLVEEGQLLVLLDATDYQIQYEKSLSLLASTVLQVRQYYDTVKADQASVENKQVALKRAQYDYQNRSKLIASEAISNEDYIHSRDTLLMSELELKQAEANLKVAKDLAGNTPLEEHPHILEQKKAVKEAYFNLMHCSIYAPATGYVAQRNVQVGQRVDSKTPLMAIIPTDYVWVDANFKETQLTYMRIGQPAAVWFDMYGSSVRYDGKVIGIASGSGSVFSLIPPQNATGNWIKIVQRLPVRISLNPDTVKHFPVRLGISAEVNVDISDQNLPMLAQAPSKRPVGETSVFQIDFEPLEKSMTELIKKHSES